MRVALNYNYEGFPNKNGTILNLKMHGKNVFKRLFLLERSRMMSFFIMIRLPILADHAKFSYKVLYYREFEFSINMPSSLYYCIILYEICIILLLALHWQ